MKIAIPVFHTKISPRFDQTRGFVLMEVERNNIVERENLHTGGWTLSAIIRQLMDRHVDTVICGGIDRLSMQHLSTRGIRVFSWVTGEVEDAVSCLLNDKMEPGIIVGNRGMCKERWRFKSGCPRWIRDYRAGIGGKKEESDMAPDNEGSGTMGRGVNSGRGSGRCKTGQGGGGRGRWKKRSEKGGRDGKGGNNRGRNIGSGNQKA